MFRVKEFCNFWERRPRNHGRTWTVNDNEKQKKQLDILEDLHKEQESCDNSYRLSKDGQDALGPPVSGFCSTAKFIWMGVGRNSHFWYTVAHPPRTRAREAQQLRNQKKKREW